MNPTMLSIQKFRLAALMFLASHVTFADSNQSEVIPFHARVNFNDTGAPTIGAIDGLTPQLESAVRNELTKMAIRPGSSDEHTAFNAILNGYVLPELKDGVVEIREASFFPIVVMEWKGERLDKESTRPYPSYPANQIRRGQEGAVELFLRIAPDGSIIEIKPLRSSHPDFELSALRAVRNWRFDPKSLLSEISGTVRFHFYPRGKPKTPLVDCPLDKTKPYVEGQHGCLYYLETEASTLRRVDR